MRGNYILNDKNILVNVRNNKKKLQNIENRPDWTQKCIKGTAMLVRISFA